KKIIGHYPGGLEVPACRDKVRNVAGNLASAADKNGPHVARVTGINSNGDAGDNLMTPIQQSHLPGPNQGIVIVTDVADAIAFELQRSVLPLAFWSIVFRLGKRRDRGSVLIHSVPAAVVEVQMRVNDHVNVFRGGAGGMKTFEQLFLRQKKAL